MPQISLKTLLVSLLLLGAVVAGPSLWRQAQRSYADFQCTGDLDAQGRCVPSSTAMAGGATMPASPLNGPPPGVPSLSPAVPAPSPTSPGSDQPAMVASGSGRSVPSVVSLGTDGESMPPSGQVSVDPIALLNAERVRAGVGPLQPDPALGAAARSHTLYLVQNHRFAHDETPGTPGFLGATPQERMHNAGYAAGEQAGTGEVVATLDGDTSDGVASLMSAIYHRFVMLTPIFQDVGAGLLDNGDSVVLTMDMGVRASRFDASQPLRVVVYPYPAQAMVPYVFIPGHEVPNPVPEQGRVGYPISVQVAPHHALAITAFDLREAGSGSPLPGKVLGATTDAEVKANEWAFVPWTPLRPAARYEVTLAGNVDGQPFNTRWTFDTAPDLPLQASVVQPVLRPGEQTWVRFSKTNANAWQVAAQVTGASAVPIRVVKQSWRGLVVEGLPGCTQPDGCPVNITVTDDQAHSSVIALRVLP